MTLWIRLNAFLKRNRGSIARNFLRQLAVRFWIHFRLWRLLRPFIFKREPTTWVFMAGCYNSGTTILREMIGSHPEIGSLPREGVELTDAFPDLEAGGWERMWFRNCEASDLSLHDPVKLAHEAILDWSPWWPSGKSVFLEKSISHGAWMPTLDAGFQNARFIGVIRNGYCACEGIRRRARPTDQASITLGRNEYPIDEVGRQWNFANKALLRDRSKVNHYHEIYYEDFVAEPVVTIRAVFNFIGVDPNVVKLSSKGDIIIGARKFTIKDQNADSLGRLDPVDRDILWSQIGPLMTEFGYKRE